MKVGKATAAAIGTGIFLLQIANHNGYIKINWDKVSQKAEKLSEKLDESTRRPNLLEKVSELDKIISKILVKNIFMYRWKL